MKSKNIIYNGKEYTFKIHKEGTGFWAECDELDGLATQGDDMEDLLYMIHDVLDCYFDSGIYSSIKKAQ